MQIVEVLRGTIRTSNPQLILGWNFAARTVCSAAEEHGEPDPRQSDRSWNEACVLPFESVAKEHAMRKVTAGVVAAGVGLLSVAPAFAIDVDVGLNGPRHHDRYHER